MAVADGQECQDFDLQSLTQGIVDQKIDVIDRLELTFLG